MPAAAMRMLPRSWCHKRGPAAVTGIVPTVVSPGTSPELSSPVPSRSDQGARQAPPATARAPQATGTKIPARTSEGRCHWHTRVE